MTRPITLGCVLLAAAATAVAQPVPLRPNVSIGMTWKFSDTQTSDSNNTATMAGQTRQFQTKTRQQRSGTAEVLAASNGVPTAMRLTFDKDCNASNEFNGQTQTQPYPYAGQTVTLTRSPDGTVKDDFPGQVDPTMSAELRALLDRDAVVMPGKPVGVGDEWSADPATAGRVLQLVGRDSGGITYKLLGVKQADGRSVAEVKVSAAVIKSMGSLEAKLVVQGVDLVDLASGHVLKTELKGTADVAGQQQAPGPDGQQQSFDMKGSGTVVIAGIAPLSGAGTAGPAPQPVAGVPAAPPPGPVAGGNPLSPSPYLGTFSDGKLKVELRQGKDQFSYEGTFNLGGQSFPARASTRDGLVGSFTAGGTDYNFTATMNGDALVLITGTTTYNLKKAAANPLDNPAPNPLSP